MPRFPMKRSLTGSFLIAVASVGMSTGGCGSASRSPTRVIVPTAFRGVVRISLLDRPLRATSDEAVESEIVVPESGLASAHIAEVSGHVGPFEGRYRNGQPLTNGIPTVTPADQIALWGPSYSVSGDGTNRELRFLVGTSSENDEWLKDPFSWDGRRQGDAENPLRSAGG